jgi:hypothetical protein
MTQTWRIFLCAQYGRKLGSASPQRGVLGRQNLKEVCGKSLILTSRKPINGGLRTANLEKIFFLARFFN